MMLHTCGRISTVLVLSLVPMCLIRETVSSSQTPTIYQQTFSLLRSPSRGVKRLGKSWTDRSVFFCAHSCTTKYQMCRSFMFNPDTGLCTPGSLYSDTEQLPNMAEGDFYHSFQCDIDKGFIVKEYGNAKACIGIFGPYGSYAEADVVCRSKGGYLASAKTLDKLQILHRMLDMNETKVIWIGCDDRETEGTYIWKEDGESFTFMNRPPTFAYGEPNNAGTRADCVMYGINWRGLNDGSCFNSNNFAACEMPLP